MTQGIVAYRLNHVTDEYGVTSVNHSMNERFIVIIDDEMWLIHANGRHELRGRVVEPSMIAGTRVETLSNLPDPVRSVIACRAEILDDADELKFEADLTI